MFGKKRIDALVAGAGPNGMVAALVLAQNGIDASIVDAASNPCTRSNAVLLHPTTVELFDRLGFADRVIAAGYRVNRLDIYDDAQPRESVHLGELDETYPFALALSQSSLESILEDELEQAGCPVKWDHRLSELKEHHDGIDIAADRYTEGNTGYAVVHHERVIDRTLRAHARLLVAADGFNSICRRLLHAEPQSTGRHQYWAFFDFETDKDPERAMRMSIKDDLTTLEIPLGNGHSRLAFQFSGITLPHEYREKDRDPVGDHQEEPELTDDTHFRQLMKERVPWALGFVNRVNWRAVAPFEMLALDHPRVGQAYFLGDAARSFGPMSAASLNLGMMEAEQLARAVKSGLDSGNLDRELSKLGERHARSWHRIHKLNTLCKPMDLVDNWVAANCSRIVPALPATGESLVQLASQIFLHVDQKSAPARA